MHSGVWNGFWKTGAWCIPDCRWVSKYSDTYPKETCRYIIRVTSSALHHTRHIESHHKPSHCNLRFGYNNGFDCKVHMYCSLYSSRGCEYSVERSLLTTSEQNNVYWKANIRTYKLSLPVVGAILFVYLFHLGGDLKAWRWRKITKIAWAQHPSPM